MSVFRHGVASGDPLTDRVIIWTRITTAERAPAPVEWIVARDADLTDIVATGSTIATIETDHTVHVDVSGLVPDTRYWFAFRAAGELSMLGRTRTLPGHDVSRVRFVQCSCSKYNAGFFNAYGHIAKRDDIDFVLHLGDYIYEASETPPASQTPGAGIGRPFDPRHECVTLGDYRRRYAQYRADPDAVAMHAAHPIVATIDDHELADGAWRDGSAEHRPDRDGPWVERRDAALRARWEWLPLRPPDHADPTRVYRSLNLGDLADLFIIDTRSRRDEPARGDATHEPSRSQLGREQADWLMDALATSTAAWQVIANGSVMSQMWRPDLPDEVVPALLRLKLIDSHGGGPDPDQWEGYPVERDRILDALGRTFGAALVLSGDIHAGVAATLSRDPLSADPDPIAIEFVTASLTSQNLDDKNGWPPRTKSVAVERRLREVWPHVRWCDLDSHGYVVVDLDRDRVIAEWWFADSILRPGGSEMLAASWMCQRGRPDLLRPTSEANAR